MRTLIILLLSSITAFAGKWTLTWDANPPIEQVVQYEAYEISSGATNSLGLVSTNRIVLNGVNPGSHTYQVVAITIDGIRSDPSTNATFVYPFAPKNLKPIP